MTNKYKKLLKIFLVVYLIKYFIASMTFDITKELAIVQIVFVLV